MYNVASWITKERITRKIYVKTKTNVYREQLQLLKLNMTFPI